jgi:hypothetical protein
MDFTVISLSLRWIVIIESQEERKKNTFRMLMQQTGPGRIMGGPAVALCSAANRGQTIGGRLTHLPLPFIFSFLSFWWPSPRWTSVLNSYQKNVSSAPVCEQQHAVAFDFQKLPKKRQERQIYYIRSTPSIPNYKAFQESLRVEGSQVWPNLYDKIIIFMTPIKYH